MPRLVINDGYTLPFSTEPGPTNLPVVSGKYRPALFDAMSAWRYDLRMAATGKAEADATAKFLADHLCEWDVSDPHGKPLPPTAEIIRKVPEPILEQLIRIVSTWAPAEQEKAAGN